MFRWDYGYTNFAGSFQVVYFKDSEAVLKCIEDLEPVLSRLLGLYEDDK